MTTENTETKDSTQASGAVTARKSSALLLASIQRSQMRTNIPEFRAGDTVKVHAKIIEGNKERVQVFEGIVISRKSINLPSATFTVRKVSYNIGVERTFLVHSPRIERIEVIARGEVRRGKLYYLRDIRGKASKVRSRLITGEEVQLTEVNGAASEANEAQA